MGPKKRPWGTLPGVFLLFFLISYWLALALYVRLCVQVRAVIRTRIQSSRHLTTEHPARQPPSAQEWLRDSLTSRKRVGVGLTASWAGIVTFLLAAAMPVVSWRLRELGWASTSAFAAMDVVAAAGIGLKLIGAVPPVWPHPSSQPLGHQFRSRQWLQCWRSFSRFLRYSYKLGSSNNPRFPSGHLSRFSTRHGP